MADAKRAERAAVDPNGPKMHAPTKRERIDPFSADAMKRLFAIAFARMEDFLDGPMTGQDLNGAFNATRLAAGVGKQPEQAKAFSIDMTSNLGVDVPEDDEPK